MGSIAHGGQVSLIAAAGVVSAAAAGLRLLRLRSLKADMSLINQVWSIAIISFILANAKSLPFVWHIRLANVLYQHVFGRPKYVPSPGPQVLFQPIITSSIAPLLECDYNIHKSNSTYFSDLDVSRANLVACILSNGIAKLRNEKVEGETGKLSIALGSVTCSFRKEIKPYERFEIWSRVLCWDRKWLYVVSHFVKKGAVKPKGYTLQDGNARSWLGRLVSKSLAAKDKKPEDTSSEKESIVTNGNATASNGAPIAPAPNKVIFASSLSRYVLKKGRLTIAPERVIQASGLLPAKPQSVDSATAQTDLKDEAKKSETVPPTATSLETLLDSSLEAKTAGTDDEVWDWNRVEEERARGMKIAQHLANLDALHHEFSGEEGPSLGEFRDLFWT